MSLIAFWGAVELGLVYAFVAVGVYLAFRVLDFPDLTVDGSFPLGAAVAAVLIIAGVNPWIASAVGPRRRLRLHTKRMPRPGLSRR